MNKTQPFETKSHSLNGKGAMDFFSKDDLNSIAVKIIPRYNPDRFDAMALRLFIQKNSPSVVLYAVDKMIEYYLIPNSRIFAYESAREQCLHDAYKLFGRRVEEDSLKSIQLTNIVKSIQV